ncbi:MAG: hypothetical protein F4Y86_18360 [Gammaproteobacteria bacterium]|nr:hypothetical protein [Gammaproteobacteria bacterium]MYB36955.1 hypothetical protein [Gammaproteobacteria bacterium]
MAWTIIGTGIALAGLHLGLFVWLRSDLKDLAKGLDKLSERMVSVATEQARTAGLVVGLRLYGHVTPASSPYGYCADQAGSGGASRRPL